jgi:hypothetical protein
MSTINQQVLYGNFQSETLQAIIEEYRRIRPDDDLPSDAILNTTLIFLRSLFFLLPADYSYRWEGDVYGEMDEAASGIWIEAEPDIHSEKIEVRPAILLSLDGRKFSGLHLDQFKYHSLLRDAYTQHDLIMGSLRTDVISRHSKECRRLADWIGLAYRLLVRYLTFDRFHSIHPEIGWTPVGSAGEKVRGTSTYEYRMASVVFKYSWGWTGRTELKPDVPGSSKWTHHIVSYGTPVLDGGPDDDGIVERDKVTHILEVEDE